MRLGQIIRDYRIKNGLSMGDFARLSGISKPYVSMLEANKNSSSGKPIVPSVGTLQKVSHAIKISLNDLLRMLDDEEICVKAESLSEEQIALLNGYDNLPNESKQLIMNMMAFLNSPQASGSMIIQSNIGNNNSLKVGNSNSVTVGR